MRRMLASCLLGLLLLAPAAAADEGGEQPNFLDFTGMWDSASPLLTGAPGTTGQLLNTTSGAAVGFLDWGSGQGQQGLGNLLAQAMAPFCC